MNARRGPLGVVAVAAAILAFQVAAGDPTSYATHREIALEHQVLAELVAAEWPNLEFSSPLADAAQAIADAGRDGHSPSSAAIRRALHDAGMPESTAVAATVATTEDGPGDVLDHLMAVVAGSGPVTHVGFGRAPSSRPPFRWQWAILLIDRRIDLIDEVPAALEPMAAFPLRFEAGSRWQHPRILVQYPGGRTRRMTPARRESSWFTVIPVGPDTGTLVLQILASNEVGPGVIAVMPIKIGKPSPEETDKTDQSPIGLQFEITEPKAAALFLWETVNSERIDHGLVRLEWDPRLANIATQHSKDMLQNDFFGHRSPSHGDLRQRLAAASYRAVRSRENLALDQEMTSAHLSLMASPGHRSNILASDVTHIGIGVVRKVSSEGPPLWIVTEILVRKNPEGQKPEEH